MIDTGVAMVTTLPMFVLVASELDGKMMDLFMCDVDVPVDTVDLTMGIETDFCGIIPWGVWP